jgi:hypothetical protein
MTRPGKVGLKVAEVLQIIFAGGGLLISLVALVTSVKVSEVQNRLQLTENDLIGQRAQKETIQVLNNKMIVEYLEKETEVRALDGEITKRKSALDLANVQLSALVVQNRTVSTQLETTTNEVKAASARGYLRALGAGARGELYAANAGIRTDLEDVLIHQARQMRFENSEVKDRVRFVVRNYQRICPDLSDIHFVKKVEYTALAEVKAATQEDLKQELVSKILETLSQRIELRDFKYRREVNDGIDAWVKCGDRVLADYTQPKRPLSSLGSSAILGLGWRPSRAPSPDEE